MVGKTAVIIGGGLSGLTASIYLKKISHYDQVLVLEKRADHTRDNFILLSQLGATRLSELGVYQAWKQCDRWVYEKLKARGNVAEMVSALQACGRLPADNPKDAFSLDCLLEDDASLDLSRVSLARVLEYQDNGIGIELARIKDLEKAMVQVANQCGVSIHYNCTDISFENSDLGISSIRYGDSVIAPDLVLICEGSGRNICKSVLGLEEIQCSPKTSKHILLQLDRYYGPTIFLSIESR